MTDTVLDPLSFSVDREMLEALAGAHAAEYRAAEPFPHIVLDDFLPAPVVERLVDEFPSATGSGGTT